MFFRARHGRIRMVVGFTTTYAINAHHYWCDFESRSGQGVQHYVIMVSVTCDMSVVFYESSDFLLQKIWRPRYNWNIVESGFKLYQAEKKILCYFIMGVCQSINVCMIACLVIYILSYVSYYFEGENSVQRKTTILFLCDKYNTSHVYSTSVLISDGEINSSDSLK